MAWFWTDDLARAALAGGLTSREAVQEWLERPVALAAGEDEEVLEVASRLLGRSSTASSAVGAA